MAAAVMIMASSRPACRPEFWKKLRSGESRCKLVGCVCFAASVRTRMTRQGLRRLVSLLLLRWACPLDLRARDSTVSAATLTDADYIGRPPPMSLWDRVFGVSKADADAYYAWAADQLERSRKPRPGTGPNRNVSFGWSAREALSPDRRKLYEMQGPECIENGGGFMPALKQCKAGCQLPGAYMCIRDMRLNKSMNVPPSCKIEQLHSFRESNCCPFFNDDNWPHTIDRTTSAYPDAFKCLESIGCGSTSDKTKGGVEKSGRTREARVGLRWISGSVVAADLFDECNSLQCLHRLNCGQQRTRNLIKDKDVPSSDKPYAYWYRCRKLELHFTHPVFGCENVAENAGSPQNKYSFYRTETGTQYGDYRRMVSVSELLDTNLLNNKVHNGDIHSLQLMYGDTPVCETGVQPEVGDVFCNDQYKNMICEKTSGDFIDDALANNIKKGGTTRTINGRKVNTCWNMCKNMKRMNSTDLLGFINEQKMRQQYSCLPTQSGARASAPAVLAPLLIAAVSLRLLAMN